MRINVDSGKLEEYASRVMRDELRRRTKNRINQGLENIDKIGDLAIKVSIIESKLNRIEEHLNKKGFFKKLVGGR